MGEYHHDHTLFTAESVAAQARMPEIAGHAAHLVLRRLDRQRLPRRWPEVRHLTSQSSLLARLPADQAPPASRLAGRLGGWQILQGPECRSRRGSPSLEFGEILNKARTLLSRRARDHEFSRHPPRKLAPSASRSPCTGCPRCATSGEKVAMLTCYDATLRHCSTMRRRHACWSAIRSAWCCRATPARAGGSGRDGLSHALRGAGQQDRLAGRRPAVRQLPGIAGAGLAARQR